MANSTKTRPAWQTIMLVGVIQIGGGVVLIAAGAATANEGFASAGGGVTVAGAITAGYGVVNSWRQ